MEDENVHVEEAVETQEALTQKAGSKYIVMMMMMITILIMLHNKVIAMGIRSSPHTRER